MKKYQINVVREERRIKTIEVEADSVGDAKSLAVSAAMDQSRESFDVDTVDWVPHELVRTTIPFVGRMHR